MSDSVATFAALGIDAETVLFVGASGFAAVVGSYFLGFGINVCKTLIAKL